MHRCYMILWFFFQRKFTMNWPFFIIWSHSWVVVVVYEWSEVQVYHEMQTKLALFKIRLFTVDYKYSKRHTAVASALQVYFLFLICHQQFNIINVNKFSEWHCILLFKFMIFLKLNFFFFFNVVTAHFWMT